MSQRRSGKGQDGEPDRDIQRRAYCLDEWQRRRGPQHAACRLENYRPTCPMAAKALAAMQSYASDTMARPLTAWNNVILAGTPGTGKDHLLSGLGAVAAEKRLTVPQWTNGPDLFAGFRRAIQNHRDEHDELYRWRRGEVLYISDPALEETLTAYQRDILYRIVDWRNCHSLPTWVSLNCPSQADAASKLGFAVLDRLMDRAVFVWCEWASYRQAAERIVR